MMVPVDGFLGQPQRNKTQCNQDCQNEIRRKQNAEKKGASVAPTTTPPLSGKSTEGARALTTTPVRK